LKRPRRERHSIRRDLHNLARPCPATSRRSRSHHKHRAICRPMAMTGARPAAYAPPEPPDPAIAEAAAADRAGIFFSLREATAQGRYRVRRSKIAYQTPQRSPVTAMAPQNRRSARKSLAHNDRVLFPGTVIPASLVTELNSESPGPVIAQVTQTIYDSATGRIALVPQGSRLMGEYRSSSRYGQSRVAIVWSRLIMPNGDEVALDEVGSRSLRRSWGQGRGR
jgi:type IV secretion system protein VirB10